MAKKKKTHKKHPQQFKHASSPVSGGNQIGKPASVAAVAQPVNMAAMTYEVTGMSLIKRDVRKVIILASSFVALQLVLWWLFEHTGLGSAVYHLIKV